MAWAICLLPLSVFAGAAAVPSVTTRASAESAANIFDGFARTLHSVSKTISHKTDSKRTSLRFAGKAAALHHFLCHEATRMPHHVGMSGHGFCSVLCVGASRGHDGQPSFLVTPNGSMVLHQITPES